MSATYFGVPREELRTAVLWVWILLSAATAASAAAPFVVDRHLLDSVTPVCVSRSKLGRECPGCGLTTSFHQIAAFNWAGAAQTNRAGLPLFALFTLNAAGCLIYVARRLSRRR
ncbi:MAG: DUF2752 domain-containing protein [Bryobacterales bacterium]|nr:DUF2752 domain-containing protein [Bryobacterales bacterium]